MTVPTAPVPAAAQPDLFANWQRLSDWTAAHYAEILTALGIGLLIVVALIDAVKESPDDPLGGLQCPRSAKYLSRAERGLLLFLERAAGAEEAVAKAA